MPADSDTRSAGISSVDISSRGEVSFDAMAPLGSALHTMGLWSNRTPSPSFSSVVLEPDPQLASALMELLKTADLVECIPPTLRKPFAWRDLFRRSMIFSGAITDKYHRYARPKTMEDWVSLKEFLALARRQIWNRSNILLSVLPIGMITIIGPLQLLVTHSVHYIHMIGFGFLGLLLVCLCGILVRISPSAHTEMDTDQYDVKYQPALSDDIAGLAAWSCLSPPAKNLWKQMNEHAKNSGIPILKGDIRTIRQCAKSDPMEFYSLL
jgi:hypothetical protein